MAAPPSSTSARGRQRSVTGSLRRAAAVAASIVLALAGSACEDGTGPEPSDARALGVVLNSIDVSLTVFDAEDPGSSAPSTIGLAPDGSPVTMAIRGRLAVVPLGTVPAAAVVDLVGGTVVRTIALPDGSGATGVAFVDDSVAVVANPGLNTVSPVNVRSGEVGAQIPVGLYPQGVVGTPEGPAVINGELGPDFQPVGPGTLTLLDGSSLGIRGSVTLSGSNPGGAAVGPSGRVYVVLSGSFGAGDGSLSVVDPAALREDAHHSGFGEFPFSVAFGPEGRLYVGSFGYGMAVWEAGSGTFVRPPDQAVTPEGIPSVAAVAVDPEGRLYTLRPDCQGPSAALRLGADYQVEQAVPVGTCPIAIAFTFVED